MGDDVMENLDIYNAVRSVPEDAKKPITAGRLKGKTDINPMWRIKALTEQFGPCGIGWYYKPIKQWTETYGDEVCVFVDIELYVKVDGEWSMPIFGTGGNMLAQTESKGIYVSDDCFKKATTDALSVACKQLGIGADVYWQEDGTKYETEKKEEINKKFEPVFAELRRTGYGVSAVCKTYKLENIYDMSDLQMKNFFEKMASVPDKKNEEQQ
jgi:hypothetical protein